MWRIFTTEVRHGHNKEEKAVMFTKVFQKFIKISIHKCKFQDLRKFCDTPMTDFSIIIQITFIVNETDCISEMKWDCVSQRLIDFLFHSLSNLCMDVLVVGSSNPGHLLNSRNTITHIMCSKSGIVILLGTGNKSGPSQP